MENSEREEALKKEIEQLKKRIVELERLVDQYQVLLRVEASLNAIVDYSQDPIIEQTLDGTITSWNQAAEKVYQYSAEEIRGKPFSTIIVPEVRERLSEIYKKLKNGELIDSFEIEHLRKDNKKILVRMTVAPLKSSDGQIIGFLTIVRDITKQREYELNIKHLNEMLKAIRNVNQLIVKEHNEANLLGQICKILADVKNYEAICITYNDKVYQAGDTRYCKKIDQFIKENVPISEKVSAYKFNEHFLAVAPIIRENICGYLYIVHTNDFNEEELDLLGEICSDIAFALYDMKIKEDRAKIDTTLRESEEKYRTLVDNSPDAIFVVDLDGNFISVNKVMVKLLGYSRDELLKMNIWDIVPSEYQAVQKPRLARILRGEPVSEPAEYKVIAKDGTEYIAEVRSAPYMKEGKIIGFQGIARDITKYKRVLNELKESELKYRTLVEQSHDGIYIYRGDRFLFVNERISEITGYTKEELYQMNIWNLVHPDERKRIKEIGEKRALGEPVPNRYIARIITRDGDVRFCEFAVTSITYQGKYAAMGAVRDITDWVNAQEDLQRTVENTLRAMAKILETRDPYTAGHQIRVAQLARAIAEKMHLSQEQINSIYTAALIHDIGKIYVPAEILSRPSALSETEFALIKNHCQVGYDILKNIKFSGPVAEIVIQHHERLDGSGYPQGLKDDDIMLEARILALADVVEAMSSHRPYRPAKGIEETMEEIEKNKGILYDPEVVDVCIKLFREEGFQFELKR